MAIGSLASTADVAPAAFVRRDVSLPRAAEIPAERGQSVDPRQAVDGRPQTAQKGAEAQHLVERRARRRRGQDAEEEDDTERRDVAPAAGERALQGPPPGGGSDAARAPERDGFPGRGEPCAVPWQAARAYARSAAAPLPFALFFDLEA